MLCAVHYSSSCDAIFFVRELPRALKTDQILSRKHYGSNQYHFEHPNKLRLEMLILGYGASCPNIFKQRIFMKAGLLVSNFSETACSG
jgi:hypothetical protein